MKTRDIFSIAEEIRLMEESEHKFLDMTKISKEYTWNASLLKFRKRKTSIYSNVFLLLSMIFAGKHAQTPTPSMVPTISTTDFLIISNWKMGISCYSIPVLSQNPYTLKLIKAILPSTQILSFFKVEQGGIYSFTTDQVKDIVFMKRNIAGPGERISIDNGGQIFIDGKPIKRKFIGIVQRDSHGEMQIINNDNKNRAKEIFELYEETIICKNKEYRYYVQFKQSDNHRSMAEIKLEDDQYFFMGDNRSLSEDNREASFVPVGKRFINGYVKYIAMGVNRKHDMSIISIIVNLVLLITIDIQNAGKNLSGYKTYMKNIYMKHLLPKVILK